MKKTFNCACGDSYCDAYIMLSSPTDGDWQLTTHKASDATRPGFWAYVVLSPADRKALAVALIDTLGIG